MFYYFSSSGLKLRSYTYNSIFPITVLKFKTCPQVIRSFTFSSVRQDLSHNLTPLISYQPPPLLANTPFPSGILLVCFQLKVFGDTLKNIMPPELSDVIFYPFRSLIRLPVELMTWLLEWFYFFSYSYLHLVLPAFLNSLFLLVLEEQILNKFAQKRFMDGQHFQF